MQSTTWSGGGAAAAEEEDQEVGVVGGKVGFSLSQTLLFSQWAQKNGVRGPFQLMGRLTC